MEYAKLLKGLRLSADMSVQELATKTKISRSNIYKIESGELSSPGLDIVRRWVNATYRESASETWFALSLRLVMDERLALLFDERSEAAKEETTQPEKILSWLIPKRFLGAKK